MFSTAGLDPEVAGGGREKPLRVFVKSKGVTELGSLGIKEVGLPVTVRTGEGFTIDLARSLAPAEKPNSDEKGPGESTRGALAEFLPIFFRRFFPPYSRINTTKG